jgi:hypothetical protein
MRGRLPDFLILGAPKSGTTSLSAWLSAHVDVFVPPQKELNFFNSADRWAEGLEWYAGELAGGGERMAGEATPTYLHDPDAAERIASTIPNARFIALLREPVDRAWSHYTYDRDLDLRATPPFEEIAASAGEPDEHRYLTQGRYVRHLRRYASLLSRDQILVLWFDDLRDRPEVTWRAACEHLGLTAEPVPESVGSVHNRHYRLRAPWVRRQMVRRRAWKRLPFGLAPRLDRLLRSEGDYDPLAPEVRDRLRRSFLEDDLALADWLGRPLPTGWER